MFSVVSIIFILCISIFSNVATGFFIDNTIAIPNYAATVFDFPRVSWVDIDMDGCYDLFVQNSNRYSLPIDYRTYLFRSNCTGTLI